MSVKRTEDTYTCDVCVTGGFAFNEVAEIIVHAYRYTAPRESDTHHQAMWRGDICRTCLGSQRAPNPNPIYENSVYLPWGEGNTGGALHRFAKWLFAPMEKESS